MSSDIAIIGIGCRYPDAKNLDDLLANFVAGKCSIRGISEENLLERGLPLDRQYGVFGYLDDIDKFDHKLFRISRAEAETMDPHQRLMLEVVYESIENAGYNSDVLSGRNVSAFLADVDLNYYRHFKRFEPSLVTGNTSSFTAARIGRQFDFRGNMMMVDTNCSASLVAVHQACNCLKLGECEMAIVGSVNLDIFPFKSFGESLEIDSPDGKSVPFSDDANGMTYGESVTSLILKPLDRAIEDHDIIHAVIKGSAIGSNGNLSASISSPDSRVVASVIKKACEAAGIGVEEIGYLEAHGSATKLGDSIEVGGIGLVTREKISTKPIPISTVKANVGHTRNSAGIAGLLRAILSIKSKTIFPTANFTKPNGLINFQQAGVEVTTSARHWASSKKRYAGITSMGLSGVACHMIIGEPPENTKSKKEEKDATTHHLITISANSLSSLQANKIALAEALEKREFDIADISYTLCVGRKHYEKRHSCICTSKDDLLAQLRGERTFQLDEAEQPFGDKFVLVLSDYRYDVNLLNSFEKFEPFHCAFEECQRAASDLGVSRDHRFVTFAFQYALYKLLVSRGIHFKSFIGFNIGKLVYKTVTEQIGLKDALVDLNQEPFGDLAATITRVVQFIENANEIVYAICPFVASSKQLPDCNLKNLFYFNDCEEDFFLSLVKFSYEKGLGVEWQKFFTGGVGVKVELPTYKFDPIRCWPSTVGPHAELETGQKEEKAIAIEPTLIEAFFEILNKRPQQNDDFFSLGGDSIKATRLIKKIESTLGVRLDFEDIFDYSTVRTLAELVEGKLIKDLLRKGWCQSLKLESIGDESNFFQLGGHSLLGNHIINSINARLGISLSFEDLYNFPTIQTLSGRVRSLLKNNVEVKAEIIRSIPEARDYELSHAQRRLWVIDQFEAAQSSYNVPAFFWIESALDEGHFERAVAIVVDRHESLRTSFVLMDGEPRQVIGKSKLRIEFVNLVGLDQAVALCQTMALEEARRPFDLARGPLFRVKIIKVAAEKYACLFNFHHIICDGWSLHVFYNDLLVCYTALKNDIVPFEEGLAIQYKDFAYWQNKIVSQQSSSKDYWLSQFQGEIPTLNFPIDKIRPQFKTFNSRSESIILTRTIKDQLSAISREGETSLFVTLFASFAILLSRYTGQNDIIIGTPVAGRSAIELQNQIGLYINTLPIRMAINPDQKFIELLKSVQEKIAASLGNQFFPLDILIDELDIARDLSRSPLFDVLFVSHDFINGNASDAMVQSNKLQLRPFETEFSPNKYDFTVYTYLTEETIRLDCGYNTDLFFPETIQALLKNFSTLIESICKNINTEIKDFDSIHPLERQWLVEELNDTHQKYASEKLIHQRFEEQARETPSNTAVIFGDEYFTYSETNSRANKFARHLQAIGIRSNENVGLMTKRGINMIVGILGIMKCGAAYVPVDPFVPETKRDYIIQNAGLRYIVTEEDIGIDIKGQIELVPVDSSHMQGFPAENLPYQVNSKDLAYIIYTSGSTGNPKGAMIEHHSVLNVVEWVNREFSITASDKILCITSVCFDLSVYDFFGSLLAGSTLVVAASEEVRNAGQVLRTIRNEGITFVNSVPTTFGHLIDFMELSENDGINCPSVRVVFLSGDWIPLGLPDRIRKYFPNAEIISLGGATECTVWSNFFKIEKIDQHWKSIPYGRPLANSSFYILDDRRAMVPRGVVGEMYIGGVGVGRGYVNDEPRTSGAFFRDFFSNDNERRLYKTGDLGRVRRDGNIEILGRKDYQVKIRGFRVELGEIENALLKIPEISAGVVVAKTSTRNEKYLVCYFTAAKELGNRDVRDALSKHLVDYMIPSIFYQMDQLPINSNGKIDRKALMLNEDYVNSLENSDISLPVTEIQKCIGEIWKELLDLPMARLSDNFFDLGGHSIKAARMAGLVGKKLGVTVDLRSIFLNPTLRELSAFVAQRSYSTSERIPVYEPSASYPLSRAQRSLWISSLLGSGAEYNVPGGCWITGNIDLTQLKLAIKAVINKHESLRTTFEVIASEPVQKVNQYSDLGYIIEEIQMAGNRQNVQRIIAEATRKDLMLPFDLSQGPLLRVKLFTLSERDVALYFCMHHLVCDGWSLEIFKRDIIDYYFRREPVYQESRINYKDFTLWERERSAKGNFESDVDFWLNKLSGQIPILQIPTVWDRPKIKTYNGATYSSELGLQLSSQVYTELKRMNVTLFTMLTSALNVLLHKSTGQSDIIVGTPIGCRDVPQLEDQIGLYLSTVPIRTSVNDEMTFFELVNAVKENMMEVYSHLYFPFEELKKSLDINVTPDRTPLFDVLIVLQNFSGINPKNDVALPSDLKIEGLFTEINTSKYDLVFAFTELGEGLIELTLEYNTDLFDKLFVMATVERFKSLLKQIIHDSTVPLSDFSFSIAEEKRSSIDFQL